MSKQQMLARSAFAILCMSLSSLGLAYEIGPDTFPLVKFDPVHQAFTKKALQCLDSESGERPGNCIGEVIQCVESQPLKQCYESGTVSIAYLGKFTLSELQNASRWPDDPTNETKWQTTPKFGVKMKRKCEQILQRKGALSMSNGLLCNSHFGQLQFWHAQASSFAEPAAETHQKILQWALFNYWIATTDGAFDRGYCDYFNSNPSAISAALMANGSFPFCDERKVLGFLPAGIARPYPGWKLSTLYGLACSNPFNSEKCKEKAINDGYEVRARRTQLAAIGALLHLVQDSYSQSHAQRGYCGKTSDDFSPLSKIECQPIRMFTSYAYFDQTSGQVVAQNDHDLSDKWPAISSSCTANKQHSVDPISGSARILWHIAENSPPDEFLKDIEEIFPEPDAGTTSGAGECYD